METKKLQFETFLNTEELHLHSHENKFFSVLKEIKERRELAEAKENFQQWWRFRWIKNLTTEEIDEINAAEDYPKFCQFRQKIEGRRSFEAPLLLIAFFALFFFGWNKFWIWYQKPLTDEWWEDEEAGEFLTQA